jgi:hypothetical protein
MNDDEKLKLCPLLDQIKAMTISQSNERKPDGVFSCVLEADGKATVCDTVLQQRGLLIFEDKVLLPSKNRPGSVKYEKEAKEGSIRSKNVAIFNGIRGDYFQSFYSVISGFVPLKDLKKDLKGYVLKYRLVRFGFTGDEERSKGYYLQTEGDVAVFVATLVKLVKGLFIDRKAALQKSFFDFDRSVLSSSYKQITQLEKKFQVLYYSSSVASKLNLLTRTWDGRVVAFSSSLSKDDGWINEMENCLKLNDAIKNSTSCDILKNHLVLYSSHHGESNALATSVTTCDGISLDEVWKQNVSYNKLAANLLMEQIWKVVEEMHLLGVTHNDLHPGNIVLSPRDKLLSGICDDFKKIDAFLIDFEGAIFHENDDRKERVFKTRQNFSFQSFCHVGEPLSGKVKLYRVTKEDCEKCDFASLVMIIHSFVGATDHSIRDNLENQIKDPNNNIGEFKDLCLGLVSSMTKIF